LIEIIASAGWVYHEETDGSTFLGLEKAGVRHGG